MSCVSLQCARSACNVATAVWAATTTQHFKKRASRRQLFSSCQEGCAVVSTRASVPLCRYPVRSAPSELMTFAPTGSLPALLEGVTEGPRPLGELRDSCRGRSLSGDRSSSRGPPWVVVRSQPLTAKRAVPASRCPLPCSVHTGSSKSLRSVCYINCVPLTLMAVTDRSDAYRPVAAESRLIHDE